MGEVCVMSGRIQPPFICTSKPLLEIPSTYSENADP
jgi:hypothetical protein